MFSFGQWVNGHNHTYSLVLGVHQHQKIIRDNLGFLYFKSKKTEEKSVKKSVSNNIFYSIF